MALPHTRQLHNMPKSLSHATLESSALRDMIVAIAAVAPLCNNLVLSSVLFFVLFHFSLHICRHVCRFVCCGVCRRNGRLTVLVLYQIFHHHNGCCDHQQQPQTHHHHHDHHHHHHRNDGCCYLNCRCGSLWRHLRRSNSASRDNDSVAPLCLGL